jgi:uncharacterized protein (TIGR02246 family)
MKERTMDDTPIRQVMDAYTAAVRAKDVDGFIGLYAPDVRVFDLWSNWSYDGAAAWRAMVASWFDSLGAAQVAVGWDSVQTLVGHDVAVVHAFISYQGVSAAGEVERAMQNRLTWVLRQYDGAWKIVHEHTSAPVDGESMKVILQR